MMIEMRVSLVLLAGCGWLPSDSPAEPKQPPPDPDVVAIAHGWKIQDHVIGTKTNLSEQDAIDLHGRSVTITAEGYTSPWQGSCEHARREKGTSSLVEITADLDVSPDGRAKLKQFGLAKDVTEYRLVCLQVAVPPLTLWLTGNRAMTCFGGVCYLLTR